ncbi:MAG: hypothetical protein ACK5QX_07540, partial [bacterium]
MTCSHGGAGEAPGQEGGVMVSPDLEKRSPESLAEEFGADGIEALPRRVDRYGKAKSRALDVAQF